MGEHINLESESLEAQRLRLEEEYEEKIKINPHGRAFSLKRLQEGINRGYDDEREELKKIDDASDEDDYERMYGRKR